MNPLVYIHIVNLNDMFNHVGQSLMEQSNYSLEAHQAQFEKELEEDYGYEMTEEFRKELEDRIYCAIEDFDKTFKTDLEES